MIKRFDRYMLRESLPAFLFGLLLYGSLMIIGAILPRLPWIAGVPALDLLAWIGLQIPGAIVQTLPIALLLAVLLACGRLASDRELLAVQSGGIPLSRIATVFLALGILATLLALGFNQLVLPAAQARAVNLYRQLTSEPGALVRRARRDIPLGDFSLSFQQAGPGGTLQGVRLTAWQDDRLSVFLADRAHFTADGLQLYGYQFDVLDFSAIGATQLDAGSLLRQLVKVDNRAQNAQQSYTITTSAGLSDLAAGATDVPDSRSILQAFHDAHDASLRPPERRHARVLFHRKLAEPFANLTLLLVAVPMAVLYARSRAIAFGLSLAVTVAWYLLLTFGQLLAQSGWLPVWLGMWGGNLLLIMGGLYLLLVRARAT